MRSSTKVEPMWFSYISKDRKIRGYCQAKDEQEVARQVGYPLDGLRVEQVMWDGERFVKPCQTKT